jgi:dipeptidyl-peptidase 4
MGNSLKFLKSIIFYLFVFIVVLDATTICAQGTRALYEASASLGERTKAPIYGEAIQLNWFDEDAYAWYRVQTGKNTFRYKLVDTAKQLCNEAFDHEQLTMQLNNAGVAISSTGLDLGGIEFSSGARLLRFSMAGQAYEFDCAANKLSKIDGVSLPSPAGTMPSLARWRRSRSSDERIEIRFANKLEREVTLWWIDPSGKLHGYGKIAAGAELPMSTFAGHAWLVKSDSGEPVAAFVGERSGSLAVIDATIAPPKEPQQRRRRDTSNAGNVSPDRKWEVQFSENNVVLKSIDSDAQPKKLTSDGTVENSYGGQVWWSPDSQYFVVLRTEPGENRMITMIDSAPDDQLQPKVMTLPYTKPGDRLDHPRPYLFKMETQAGIAIDDSLFPNPFDLSQFDWRVDSKAFRFVYNQRGHQVLRVLEFDPATAQVRVLVDEQSKTFINYSQSFFLQFLDDSKEIIWMTERSGWNHLVLIDQSSGQVKNAITTGDWVVRGIERIDLDKRQAWVRASGVVAGQDPYYVHLLRVNLDGTGLTHLTEGDGTHQWDFSPTQRWIVDRYSRVDMPPVTELRNAEDGRAVCKLESADWSDLLKTGWQPPERFQAFGRDGVTKIFGVILRPTHFDPSKKYPVLEHIYAGPHSAFVPKAFGRQLNLMEIAELGFIVVQIDGMGTSHRSKAFHDVCWQNLGDSGFPDRIRWIQAAAAAHPEMDLTHGVGIWGGSAGGQSALRALLAHSDFYSAAVADCGCHDNRMDKIWWNEQWMGWPIGPHYAEQSNVTQAHRLQGKLLLIVGELDNNVDPASTMQVVDALIKADKDFDLLVVPGAGHGIGSAPYGERRAKDFFVRHLWHREPRQE